MFSLNINLKTWIASFSRSAWKRQNTKNHPKDNSEVKASKQHKHYFGLSIPPWGTWGFQAWTAWKWVLTWCWERSTAPQTPASSWSPVFPETNVPRFWGSPARPDLQTKANTDGQYFIKKKLQFILREVEFNILCKGHNHNYIIFLYEEYSLLPPAARMFPAIQKVARQLIIAPLLSRGINSEK